MVKVIKYFLLCLLLLITVGISYFIFESLSVKKSINYQNIEEVPKVSWLNIRSGIFGLVIKATNKRTLEYYDKEKYLSVIAPSEDKFKEYPEASLYYLISGVIPTEATDTKLFKYPAVFRTKFKNNDYLLFLQENIQKDGKTGYILITYPVNLIQTKSVGEFIDMITNKNLSAPIFPPVYKFNSFETCNQNLSDKNYCKWLISNQNKIYQLIKKWGDADIVPVGMMRYPLILNKNRI